MTAVAAAVAAWDAWEAAVANRDRVVALDDALRPIASSVGMTVTELRALVTRRLQDGWNVRGVLESMVTPDLFDDDDVVPWATSVPVGEYL